MPSQERDLSEKVKAISKAVTGNEPSENVLSLLNALKKDDPPTEDALRSTRAGVVVGKLRSNQNRDIARAAADLVTKWKKAVEAEKQSRARAAKLKSPSATPASSGASPAPTNASHSKPYTGDPEKRRFDIDGVDTKRTGSKTRDGCIGLMYNGLAFRSTDSVEDVITRAVEIENAGFVAYKGETAEYRNKIRSLFQNLKNKTNRELGRKVMAGEIAPDKFVVMSHEELKSAEQRLKDDAFEKENMKKAQVPMAEKSISDALKCSRCGQRKVSYSQAQTRSADEPMTTFCECTICGHRWKFS